MSSQTKTWWVVFALLAAGGILVLFVIRSEFFRQRDPAEWNALAVTGQAVTAIMESDHEQLLRTIVAPSHLARFTDAEVADFLGKALSDEVSPEGLEVMRREAQFGRLTELFPEEGPRWAQSAGVRVEDCVAFRLEKLGVVAEIGIVTSPAARVIRLNNVRQIAVAPVPGE